jgi:hypothetical protein
MGTLVDVFVGNYPEIDWDLYSLWVEVWGDQHASEAFIWITALGS